MADPVLTVLSEVLWDHLDRVLFETKAALHDHGEDDVISSLNASAADVATVFAAIINPGNDLRIKCPRCNSRPAHTCVDNPRRTTPRTTSHPERKAALIRKILAQSKEEAS